MCRFTAWKLEQVEPTLENDVLSLESPWYSRRILPGCIVALHISVSPLVSFKGYRDGERGRRECIHFTWEGGGGNAFIQGRLSWLAGLRHDCAR